MKKLVLIIIPIILLLGGAYGSKVYMDERHFDRYVKAAQQDIKKGAWQAAKQNYQKANRLHSTVETTAALQQLAYVTKAQKQIDQGHKKEAQETMELALYVKHPVPAITKAIKAEFKELDQSNKDHKQKDKSKKEKNNKADTSSSLSAQSPVEETPSQTTPAVVSDQSQATVEQGGATYQAPQPSVSYDYVNPAPADEGNTSVGANDQGTATTNNGSAGNTSQASQSDTTGASAAGANS